MKKLKAITLIYILSISLVLAAEKIEYLKIGKQLYYFKGVKSTAVDGLSDIVDANKNTKIVVFLCTNAGTKKLSNVMLFLHKKGINDVTIKSSTEKSEC